MDKIKTSLSEEQIDQLFLFTKKKYVHFYDLQVELVDHLATSIEEEMDAEPSLTFENALQKVYSRFGIFGFAKVVQERSEALVKSNNRIWLKEIKQFFTVPKIAFTAFIFLGSLYIGQFLSAEAKAWIAFAAWVVLALPITNSYIKWKKTEAKKLLLTQYTSYIYSPGFIIPYCIFIPWSGEIHNNFLFATLVIIIIVSESAIWHVGKRVRKKASELYSEAFKIA